MSSIPIEFNGSFEQSEFLTNFTCWECKLPISASDIAQKNYRLYVSNQANEVQQVFEGEEDPVYFLHFWLKAVQHQHCSLFLPQNQRTLPQVRGTEP